MNKKIIALILITIIGIMATGCGAPAQTKSPTKSQQQLEQDAGVANVRVGASHFTESKQTEVIQQGLMTANPIPKISRSLERENLAKRLDLLNDQSKIFYVYLVSYGKVMAYYTAQGKVSSVNSKLTTQEQIVRDPACTAYNGRSCRFIVESPDLDGSYGTNGDGIFFFTTGGAYVEWAGEYMVSDYPLALSTPPELVRSLK